MARKQKQNSAHTPAQTQQQTQKLATPANIVTLLRICFVPVFVVALISPWPAWFGLPHITNGTKSLIAAGIFILISASDWLDGYLARSRGEVSDFGKFADPLADKILVVAALLALVELGSLPCWVALIIVTREFIVSGVRMVAASKGVVIAASWYGKFKTVFQMIAIVLFTIKDSYMQSSFGAALGDTLWLVSWGVMTIALVLTVVSMLDYIAKAASFIGLAPEKESANANPSANDDAKPSANLGLNTNRSINSDASVFSPEIVDLAEKVIKTATEKGISIGTAESLTGGLICAALTEVPGSSAAVSGCIGSYATDVKQSVLCVSEKTLQQHTVVSEQVASEMAKGASSALKCNVAVAVTGIAGPGGAMSGKPVGTVCAACACNGQTQTVTWHFSGKRASVRTQTVKAALELMLNTIQQC